MATPSASASATPPPPPAPPSPPARSTTPNTLTRTPGQASTALGGSDVVTATFGSTTSTVRPQSTKVGSACRSRPASITLVPNPVGPLASLAPQLARITV